MSLVRGIWADLVDKRLWPIALALAVAAVAIPVVLHKEADKVSGSPAAREAAGTRLPAGSNISLNQEHAQGLLVGGRMHDPFHQLYVPKAAATATATSALGPATASSGASAPSGQGDSGGGSSGGGSSGGGHKQPAATAKVRVAFGKAGSSLRRSAIWSGWRGSHSIGHGACMARGA